MRSTQQQSVQPRGLTQQRRCLTAAGSAGAGMWPAPLRPLCRQQVHRLSAKARQQLSSLLPLPLPQGQPLTGSQLVCSGAAEAAAPAAADGAVAAAEAAAAPAAAGITGAAAGAAAAAVVVAGAVVAAAAPPVEAAGLEGGGIPPAGEPALRTALAGARPPHCLSRSAVPCWASRYPTVTESNVAVQSRYHMCMPTSRRRRSGDVGSPLQHRQGRASHGRSPSPVPRATGSRVRGASPFSQNRVDYRSRAHAESREVGASVMPVQQHIAG